MNTYIHFFPVLSATQLDIGLGAADLSPHCKKVASNFTLQTNFDIRDKRFLNKIVYDRESDCALPF